MNTEPLAEPRAPAVAVTPGLSKRVFWLCALLIAALGIFVRVLPWAGFTGVGFDEALYRDYLVKLDKVGLLNYPAICEIHLEDQRDPKSITKLPPTRFLYVYSAWLWKRLEFGDAPPASQGARNFAQTDPAMVSLHRVSALFSSLLFLTAGLCAYRMLGGAHGLAVLALMACAPVQIHMAQHALIDGFFAFWAMLCLWLLWENLQRPNHPGRLCAYGAALAAMVLTKENAFFVYVALCGLLLVNRWMRFGQVTPRLLAATLLGPLAGVAILVNLAGGLPAFIETYRLLVSKAGTLEYAVQTGDGPWHRYLVDMLIVSPLVLCLAIGALFSSLRNNRPLIYLGVFVALTYAFMCNVKYSMNLRYSTIWDLPLCALASTQVFALTAPLGRRGVLATIVILVGLCLYGIRQYDVFFVEFKLYELVTGGLLQAVKILKFKATGH